MAKRKKKSNKKIPELIAGILGLLGLIGVSISLVTSKGEVQLKIEYKEQGQNEEITTVEEIDGGGLFQDQLNIENGEEALFYELGAIEEVETSTVDAFIKSTLGRCIVADNYYGAQCVSLARAFWWSYAGFDVSTCGTGLAKGMMNCYDTNARDKFKVIWNTSEVQRGTWIVLDGSRTGHICMALDKVKDGYVSCLGENQGGVPCEYGIGGAATNIINLSVKNFIGGYTPLDYIEPEPTPEPVPVVPDTGVIK